MAIKNLIFDLGNVIIDIDYAITLAEFQKLAKVDFAEIISYSAQHHVFDKFETGKLTAQQFRDELKKFLKDEATDEAINHAWNTILIDYPEKKFKLLKELKTRYKTFALSNINELHVSAIDAEVAKRFGVNKLEDFFDTAYYSNVVGYRKPEKEIYELVQQRENLNPAETFFVDDKEENIEAAKALGWQAYQLPERDKLFELLTELKII